MARLPALRPQEVVRILERAGFRFHHQTGSHAFYRNGQGRIVCVPIHPREIKKGVLHSIIKQAGMTREEFLALR